LLQSSRPPSAATIASKVPPPSVNTPAPARRLAGVLLAPRQRAGLLLAALLLAALPLTTLVLALMGSGCATGTARRHCGDAEQDRWLSACAFALPAAARREHPRPSDPWLTTSREAFASAAPLADHLVAACEELMREPWRIAARDRQELARSGWPPIERACTEAQHREWLRACEADAKAIAGRTRRELLAVFDEEGGLSAMDERDYFHRRCTALKIHVTFRLVSDGHAGNESPEDVVLQAAARIDPYFVFD
jgi:hypothetical protein